MKKKLTMKPSPIAMGEGWVREFPISFIMVFQTGPTKRTPITVQRARSLRRGQTVSEMLLWRELKNRGLNGLKFRRQVPIGPFIVDFYCAERKLIVELDGFVHEKRTVLIKDRSRERYLRKNGYEVMRFTNDDVNDDMLKVLREIVAFSTDPHPCPSPSAEGEGSRK